VDAGKLEVGDRVLRPNGKWTRITRIEYETREITVYNFEVEGNHSYFVGEIGVLSHNCDIAALATKFAKKFPIGMCHKCADALADTLKSKGIKGDVIEIRSNGANEFIISDNYMVGGRAVSETGMHQGVRVGNMVYDNITPQGIPYDEWVKSFAARSGMQAPQVIRSF